MPDTYYKGDGDKDTCGVCVEPGYLRAICRHGREYVACQAPDHIEYQIKTALEYDGFSGVRVVTVGWVGG